MIFRPVRGLLSESLADSKEITTMQELEDLISRNGTATYWEYPLQVSWENQGYDSRIKADSWIICAKMKGYDHPYAAGYTHDDPSKLIGYKSTDNG